MRKSKDWLTVRRSLRATRRFYDSELGLRKAVTQGGRDGGAPSALVLAVVGGYPAIDYVRLGYDWLAPYYNPLLIFDEVHYFQNGIAATKIYDWGYPFYTHGFSTDADVISKCRQHKVRILRAYDTVNGRVAISAARALDIPVIVSVH